MSVGKYSPTVSASYAMDQKWWERNGGGYGNGTNPDSDYDNDGYDSYGYAGDCGDGPDRAGNTESDYLTGGEFDDGDEYVYPLYSGTSADWARRLLGDLDQYRSLFTVCRDNGLKQKSFDLYREYILKLDWKYLRGGMFGNHVYVHVDHVDEIVAAYHKYVPETMR